MATYGSRNVERFAIHFMLIVIDHTNPLETYVVTSLISGFAKELKKKGNNRIVIRKQKKLIYLL